MGRRLAALLASRSSWFDLCVFASGLLLVASATLAVVRGRHDRRGRPATSR